MFIDNRINISTCSNRDLRRSQPSSLIILSMLRQYKIFFGPRVGAEIALNLLSGSGPAFFNAGIYSVRDSD